MLKVTHRKGNSQRRYYEAAKGKDTDIIEVRDSDGNVIDERICNISIMPKEDVGNRPIDKEIDVLLNYLRTGKTPSRSYVVLMRPSERLATLKAQYGDDWKQYWDSATNSPMVPANDVYDPFYVPLMNAKGKILNPDDDKDFDVLNMKDRLASGKITQDEFDAFMAKRQAEIADAQEQQALKQAPKDSLRSLNYVSCSARVKKLLTACQENGLMSDDYIRDLLSDFVMAGETDRIPLTVKNTYDDVIISAALLKRDYPELFAGVRDRIYSTVVMSDIDKVIEMIGHGDYDKEVGHGLGAHHHNPALNPKDDDGNYLPDNGLKDPEGQRRLAGVNPDPDNKKKVNGDPGNRPDWQQSSYRTIAENEALKYIKRLEEMFHGAAGTSFVDGRSKVSSASLSADVVRSMQTDYTPPKRSGFSIFDTWNGDPSQQDVGFETAHYLSAGIKVTMGSFPRQEGDFQYNNNGRKVSPDWKLPMTLTIYIPSVGSLDDPDKTYDLSPFAVGLFFDKSYSSGVSNIRRYVDEALMNFKARIEANGLGYGVKYVEDRYSPMAYCFSSNPKRQEDALRFIVRCACGCLGEIIDMVDGIEANDEDSIARQVNMYYTERKRMNAKRTCNLKRGRKLEYVSDSIENVVDLLVALEEYSGSRYTSDELRSGEMCYICNQRKGGNSFYIRLEEGVKGEVLSCYYFNLDSVVDDCVSSAAEDLSDYSGNDLTSAILESLSVNLDEAWTEDYEFYTLTNIPCSKQKLFQMFDEMSDAVHDYILDLAEDNCSAVEDLLEDDEDEDEDEYEDDDEYEESRRHRTFRTRVETRRNGRSSVSRRFRR